MVGEIVEHPQYGCGQVLAIYRNGAEWLVRFGSGLRFRRPRHEFNGQQRSHEPSRAAPPAFDAQPMPRTQFEARQLVEALRVGVAPVQHLQELTIGLTNERSNIVAGLNRAHQAGGAVRAVVGDYGFGKSHIVELTTQEALQRNFLVASVALDLTELPPYNGMAIYAGLLSRLRYPNDDERGLEPLLDLVRQQPHIQQQIQALAAVAWAPLAVTLHAITQTSSTRLRRTWGQWLLGGRRDTAMNTALPRGIKLPSIYRTGNNARQLAYLLSDFSVLARLAGFSGFCLLIDEAESYSLLRSAQRAKAALFFRALIHAAGQPSHAPNNGADLPQHHQRAYPLTYGGRQALFFLFTTTRSTPPMPLDDWLNADQILVLDPHHTAQEIGQFLQQVMGYHAQAYGYEPGERQGQIRRAAAEILALGMRNNRLSIRGVVRVAVDLFDLLYLHPDYATATLLDELRALAQ